MAADLASGKALHSLKVNATRLEHSRDLGLIDSFASGSGGGAGKYLENGAVVTSAGIEETKRMLASKRESERMEGLKRVIAMMTKALPVTSFFPLVTSLLSPSTPLQARTLVSLYIIHCASTAPELALLSINAYQKDLSDPNPIVRAGALTTLSSMGLEDIRSLVGVAVAKGARDGSWYVRRAAADAVTALWKADPTPENGRQLLKTLDDLLKSASPLTMGSTLAAWEHMCPTRWDLIHPLYRKWCKLLMDVEEWGQVALLRVLTRYGRTFFLDPAQTGKLDPDAELLLKSSEPLLQHLNPAVVSAAVRLHYYLALPSAFSYIVRPFVRLLKSAPELQLAVLEDCAVVAEERPDIMADFVSDFLVRASDAIAVKRLRLRILVALASEKTVEVLLREFLTYVKDPDESFSGASIAAIGTCARRVPAVASECLKTLIKLSRSKSDNVIAQSVLVLRSLLFASTASRAPIIRQLVLLVEAGKIRSPVARANIYWLVGQYASQGLLETVGPDLVRLGTKGFGDESDAAKLQLLTLSAKLLVLAHLSPLTPNLRTLALLFSYLTTLARYDLAYEVRDRARFLKALLASADVGTTTHDHSQEEDSSREGSPETVGARTMTGDQVRKVLFEGKETEIDTARVYTGELGTFALSIPDRRLAFTSPLPAYSTTVPPSTIRDVHIPVDGTRQSHSPSGASTPVLRGFGSDSPRGIASGRASPVVLVPTNFAHAGEDYTSSAGASLLAAGKKGFVDLDDFYGSGQEEEDGTEESEESGENESEEEEEESGEEESSEEETKAAAPEQTGT